MDKPLAAAAPLGVLAGRFDSDRLPSLLLPRASYHPYPTWEERDAWRTLPKDLVAAHLTLAESYLDYGWPPLTASLFMEFTKTGNRSHYESVSLGRRHVLGALVAAECMEGEGRFLEQIANGIWAICEETFWGVPAHNKHPDRTPDPLPDASEPIIDLFAGETAGLLAWTDYLLSAALDEVSVLLCRRIRSETKRRIMDPFLARNDFWWMGADEQHRVNNWNPWCTSNCLAAALLLDEDQSRRVEAVAKSMVILDRFLATYTPDGGCDEGTSYWTRAGASLFDCLELLYQASEGKVSVYDEPLIAEMGRYIYRAHIAGDYYINFADGSARLTIPAALAWRYGTRIEDPHLRALGAAVYQEKWRQGQGAQTAPRGLQQPLMRLLPALFAHEAMMAASGRPPLLGDVWLEDIQVMAGREKEGEEAGFYLAAKGGHNGESHNHNDVGQFIVYLDGQPLIVDPGVETYTARTFGPERYDIWTMQSAYHNLPTINGVQQSSGHIYSGRNVVRHASRSYAELSLDLAGAYDEASGLQSWHRTIRLSRRPRPGVELIEDFVLAEETEDVVLSLMTPCEPTLAQPGEITFVQPGARLEYDKADLLAAVEPIPLEDPRLSADWGTHLYRILLRTNGPTDRGTWVIKISRL